MPTSFDMFSVSKTNAPTADDEEVAADPDEPPDHRRLAKRPSLAFSRSITLPPPTYAKTKAIDGRKKESLLTRALLSSPELSPIDSATAKLPTIPDLAGLTTSSALSNRSIASTAELTSDSETTSPFRSNTPSPPPQYNRLPHVDHHGVVHAKPVDQRELQLEANLGRKRCITFACGRQLINEENKASSEPIKEASAGAAIKRKSALTFICPTRPGVNESDRKEASPALGKAPLSLRASRSPAPSTLRGGSHTSAPNSMTSKPQISTTSDKDQGKQQNVLSDAVRFHEFGSESDDDDWVNQETNYKQKITMNDCMKKELAIRKLGEEAEEEARQDEEDDAEINDEDDDDDDLEDEDDEDDDEDGDDGDDSDDGRNSSTIQEESDGGNESDNEAGFASSDDESDGSGEYAFWTQKPTSAVKDNAPQDLWRGFSRRESNTSVETHRHPVEVIPVPKRRPSKASKPVKFRPGTPTLPDSTDFVCGTLDEDRPIEAAYVSCLEERRRSKHVPIPQDIDPSFPTSGPEDEDDDEEETVHSKSKKHSKLSNPFKGFDEESLRGRQNAHARRTTPHHSPKRLHSPPPRRLFGRSPRHLRSPPPHGRLRSPPPTRRTSVTQRPPAHHVHFNGLAQRPNRTRTSSLPRTPNPFFARLAQPRQISSTPSTSPVQDTAVQATHTRGPIDIVAGLEKKREKRKEKFWRQHCRKAAKEQLERKKPLCGKGAERMRERGLEAAERFKGYNVITDGQLVLSV
ncbi:hypothetical protein LOZ53_006207 [Ophidiomyces ophidiicola]|nr:hypothetical protein LOZ53_006207 [Ophidiomyces ophidiicola]KAI1992650.1 hypothetical protein LOZ54_001618 [Ophidiomyces ophidiicola]